MRSNQTNINSSTKNIINQTAPSEPSINILSKLNSIANENFHQIIPSIVCEICYKADNLIICEICKNGFHKKCLGSVFLPEHYICTLCQNHFTEEEISQIMKNTYKQSYLQKKTFIDSQRGYKNSENKKIKKKLNVNTIIDNTKIIELDEEKNEENSSKKNDKSKSEKNLDIIRIKPKNIKKKLDNNSSKPSSEINNHEKSEKADISPIKKELQNKILKENDKFSEAGGGGGGGDTDLCEKSILSVSRDLNLDKSGTKVKKRKKDKELNNAKSKGSSTNNIIICSPKDNNNKSKVYSKDELSISQTQSSKKSVKKKHIESKNEREQSLLLSLVHTDPQYKKRKIKFGPNRQCNVYDFKDRYENKINFDEEEYERNDLIQVWSVEKNPLSEEELNKYIEKAKLFWNYRNVHIEEDLCSDFFQECEQKMKTTKISTKLKNKINKLIKELKELVEKGITLDSHYEEMSLRVLHLCKYKTNVALFFLFKGLNPFIEEVEEGFKHDIYFFQDEIYSFINNGDFFDPEN
jgi:hypothetical protein